MRKPVLITGDRPTGAEAARTYGVSKSIAKKLAYLAENSLKTGEYEIPVLARWFR